MFGESEAVRVIGPPFSTKIIKAIKKHPNFAEVVCKEPSNDPYEPYTHTVAGFGNYDDDLVGAALGKCDLLWLRRELRHAVGFITQHGIDIYEYEKYFLSSLADYFKTLLGAAIKSGNQELEKFIKRYLVYTVHPRLRRFLKRVVPAALSDIQDALWDLSVLIDVDLGSIPEIKNYIDKIVTLESKAFELASKYTYPDVAENPELVLAFLEKFDPIKKEIYYLLEDLEEIVERYLNQDIKTKIINALRGAQSNQRKSKRRGMHV